MILFHQLPTIQEMALVTKVLLEQHYHQYGDRFATPEEMVVLRDDSLGWVDLVRVELIALTGHDVRNGKVIVVEDPYCVPCRNKK